MDAQNTKKEHANLIVNWVRDEVKLGRKTRDVANVSNFTKLFKSNATTALWIFVQQHVKSKENANFIRHNLQLKKMVLECKANEEQKHKLETELEKINKDNEANKMLLKKLKIEWKSNNLTFTEIEQENKLLSMKSCLTSANANKLDKFSNIIQSYITWFKNLSAVYQKRKVQASDLSTSENCLSDLMQLCKGLLGLLNKADGGDKVNESEEFVKLIASLHNKFSPHIIVNALNLLVQQEIGKIITKRKTINFVQDLKDLDKKFGNKKDENSLVKIEHLLQNVYLKYVQDYTESMQSLKEVNNIIVECDSCRKNVLSWFAQKYDQNEDILNLARNNFDLKVELSAMQTTVQAFEAAAITLKEEIASSKISMQKLKDIKVKISNFKNVIDENQMKFLKTAKHNSSVKSNIGKKQTKISACANNFMLRTNKELSSLAINIQSSTNSRLHLFHHCSLMKDILHLKLPDEIVPIYDISLNRTLQDTDSSISLQSVCTELGIYTTQTPAQIIMHILHLKEELKNFTTQSNDIDSDCEAMNKNLAHVIKKAIEVDNQQKSSLIPLLKQGLSLVATTNQERETMNEEIDVWFNLPAKEYVSKYCLKNNS